MDESPNVNMPNEVDYGITNIMTGSGFHSITNTCSIVPAAGDGVSTNARRVMKRTSEQVFGEFVTGESSSSAGGQAPANMPKRRAGIEINASMSSPTAAACTCTSCPQHSTFAAHRSASSWSSAEVQRALQAADNYNYNGQAEAVNNAGAASSSIGYVFGQPSSLYRNSPASDLPQYIPSSTPNVARPGTSAPLPPSPVGNSNNVPSGSYMFAPGTGRENNMTQDSGFFMGIGNLAQFPPPPSSGSNSHHHHQLFSSHPLQPSRIISSWMQRLNDHEDYLRAWISNNNNDLPPSTTTSASSQVPNNTTNAAAAAAAPAASNSEDTLTLIIQGPGGIYQHRTINVAPFYINDINMLKNAIRGAIQHLRNGGSLSLQNILVLDYSIVLSLLESIENSIDEDENEEDEEDYDNGLNDMGLYEAEALELIGRETFQSNPNENGQNDACCICQEDYVNGEELGKLDCAHKYHLACILPWLVRKNICPICKQTAIDIDKEDDEENEE